jgi:quinolinate synthase
LADIVAPSRELIRSLSAQQPSTVILATDHGLAPLIRRRLPKAELLPLPAEDNCACTHCPYMRLNTVSKLYSCLRNMAPEISLPDDLLERARPPLQRLLEWGTASGEADLLA